MSQPKYHTFDIKATQGGYGSEILMDGEPLRGVRSISFNCAVKEATTVTVTFLAEKVNVEPAKEGQ